LFSKTESDILSFERYALAITNGETPSGNLDVSFFESLNLQGYVRASQRGTVSGSYSGTLSGQPVVIGFKVCTDVNLPRSYPSMLINTPLELSGPVLD
jgi:hypothetical protein